MDRLEVKYDCDLDLQGRNSLKLFNDRIKDNAKILEFGPANGRFTRFLKNNRNCCVDIVEYNNISGQEAAQYARNAFLGEKEGDIENYIWAEKLVEEKYDFILFADVLEHLYDPTKVLKVCKEFLKADGAILLSVPNIANNNIILNLLNDEFNYTSTGLLDDTHIRFFTYKTLFDIAEKLGYSVCSVDYTLGLPGETEVDIKSEKLDKYLPMISEHHLGNIYQLVFELRKNAEISVKNEEMPIIWYPSAYYSNAGMYSEKTHLECSDLECDNDVYTAKFYVSGLVNENKFRFDPIEGCQCLLELMDIRVDMGNLNVNCANAFHQEGGCYYFLTTDPVIEFEGELSGATFIELRYKLTLLDNAYLSNMINRLLGDSRNELERVKFDLEKTKGERDELKIERDKNTEEISRLKAELLACYNELHAIKNTRGYKMLEYARSIRGKVMGE